MPSSKQTKYIGIEVKRIGISSSPGCINITPVPTHKSNKNSPIAKSKLELRMTLNILSEYISKTCCTSCCASSGISLPGSNLHQLVCGGNKPDCILFANFCVESIAVLSNTSGILFCPTTPPS